MTDWQKRHLLEVLGTIAPGLGTAENESKDDIEFLRNFLPIPEHRRALEPDVLLVLGGRGTGKTQLFSMLSRKPGREALFRDQMGRQIPNWERGQWAEGWGQGSKTLPTTDELTQLGAGSSESWRIAWLGLLVGVLLQHSGLDPCTWTSGLTPEVLSALHRPQAAQEWFSLVASHLSPVNSALDQLDEHLARSDQWMFVTYDGLDTLSPSYGGLVVPIRSLLSFWLERWSRWDRIRPKIFLRTDLFREEFLQFPDASKLAAHQVHLEWKTQWLYRLLVKRLANADEEMLSYLEQVPSLLGEPDPLLGRMPSRLGAEEQLMEKMIGRFMGANPRKGNTYLWIPNHLQDAGGRIAPRSFLKLFTLAAEDALEAERYTELPGTLLLRPQDLQGSLMKTSDYRIAELAEEYPWLASLKRQLAGIEVPVAKEIVLNAIVSTHWGTAGPEQPPSRQPAEILDHLRHLGVVELRTDGRINFPEIYLYGFKLKRRGGIRRPV